MHHLTRAIDPERRKWQDPEAILGEAGLKAGLTFVDIGCGGGFVALPAARMVGPSGRVYGIDTDTSAIKELREAAAREGLHNLEVITSRAEDTIVCRRFADIAFLGIDLHDFADPLRVLRNARLMLKPRGWLVDLDWKAEPTPVGPPLAIRFSQEKAVGLIREAGFTVLSQRETGLFHYLITARPR
jgi:ubiquinone/menaquinone biosynthesis C-methylase UbiE